MEINLYLCFCALPQHQAQLTSLLISESSAYSNEIWTILWAQCGVYGVLSLADVIKAMFPADITNAASRRPRELSLSRGL